MARPATSSCGRWLHGPEHHAQDTGFRVLGFRGLGFRVHLQVLGGSGKHGGFRVLGTQSCICKYLEVHG